MRLWFVILGCFVSTQHILWSIKKAVRKLSVSAIVTPFLHELEFAEGLFSAFHGKKEFRNQTLLIILATDYFPVNSPVYYLECLKKTEYSGA